MFFSYDSCFVITKKPLPAPGCEYFYVSSRSLIQVLAFTIRCMIDPKLVFVQGMQFVVFFFFFPMYIYPVFPTPASVLLLNYLGIFIEFSCLYMCDLFLNYFVVLICVSSCQYSLFDHCYFIINLRISSWKSSSFSRLC